MPGIKIYRKSRLKNENTEKIVEQTIQEVKNDEEVNTESLPTPEEEPQPYVIKDYNSVIDPSFYQTFPDHLKGNQQIFIQIAAYRDPELVPTIESIIANADEPDNLRFGICWQHHMDDDFDKEMYEYMKDERFQVIDVDNKRGHGTCWERHSILHLYYE